MINTENIQVVVLMGGLGTRLKGAAVGIPKPMVDVYGHPFIFYQLSLMKWYGFKRFLFCTGNKEEVIKDYWKNGDGWGIAIDYSSDGDNLLGTGGALRNALIFLQEEFMVIYGDSFMDVDYSEFIYRYFEIKENKKGLMAIYRNNNQYDKSNVIFKYNKLLMYDKVNTRLEMEYIDYGITMINRNVIERLPEGKTIDLSDVLHELALNEQLAGHEVKKRFYEIGSPESLEEFKNYIYLKSVTKKPTIFLDRDGTINEMVFSKETEQFDSPLKKEEMKLLPGVASALQLMQSLGYLLIVVTNQPAAAKGKATLRRLYEMNLALKDILVDNDVILDDILMCPHHPLGSSLSKEKYLIRDCECRKPKPGLLRKAFEKYNVENASSYLVGDSIVDIMAGKAAGLTTVLIGKYKCDSCNLIAETKPDFVFGTLFEFASYLSEGNIYDGN